METTKTTFILNSAYKNFVSGQTKLKTGETDKGGCANFIMSVMSAMMFVGMVVAWVTSGVNHHLLSTSGEVTVGQVTDCEMSKNKQNELFPYITYVYEWNARRFVREVTIDIENEDCSLYQGKPIAVYFLAANPDIAQITPPSAQKLSILELGLMVIFPLFMLWMMIHSLREFRRIRRLEKTYACLNTNGVVLTGTVVDVQGCPDTKHKKFDTEVLYEFVTPSGQIIREMHKASFGPVASVEEIYELQDPDDPGLPTVGMPVSILYADDNTYVML